MSPLRDANRTFSDRLCRPHSADLKPAQSRARGMAISAAMSPPGSSPLQANDSCTPHSDASDGPARVVQTSMESGGPPRTPIASQPLVRSNGPSDSPWVTRS